MPGPVDVPRFEILRLHTQERRYADQVFLRDVDIAVSIAAPDASRLALKSETFVHLPESN